VIKYKYFFRQVSSRGNFLIRKRDGDEIYFGQGQYAEEVTLPNPVFCNLRLRIARVLHASGAAEVLEQYDRDMEELMDAEGVYFGGPYFSDDVLMERITSRLVEV
jgi:hypothetical protein